MGKAHTAISTKENSEAERTGGHGNRPQRNNGKSAKIVTENNNDEPSDNYTNNVHIDNTDSTLQIVENDDTQTSQHKNNTHNQTNENTSKNTQQQQKNEAFGTHHEMGDHLKLMEQESKTQPLLKKKVDNPSRYFYDNEPTKKTQKTTNNRHKQS